MRKLNGITINGEYLGNSVVINGMFRAICTISPVIMRDFVQIINRIDRLEEAVKIKNFNWGFDSIDIEFNNSNTKGIASLYFKLIDGEPELTDCRLIIDDKEYSTLSETVMIPSAEQEQEKPLQPEPENISDKQNKKELSEEDIARRQRISELKAQKLEKLRKQKEDKLNRQKNNTVNKRTTPEPTLETESKSRLETLLEKKKKIAEAKANLSAKNNDSAKENSEQINKSDDANYEEIESKKEVTENKTSENKTNLNADKGLTNSTVDSNPTPSSIENKSLQEESENIENEVLKSNAIQATEEEKGSKFENIEDIDLDNLSEEELAELEAQLEAELEDEDVDDSFVNDNYTPTSVNQGYDKEFLETLSHGLVDGLTQGLSQGIAQGLAEGLSQGLSQLSTQGFNSSPSYDSMQGNQNFGGGFSNDFNTGYNSNNTQQNFNNSGGFDFSASNNDGFNFLEPSAQSATAQQIQPDYTDIDNLNADAAMEARNYYSYDENSNMDDLSDLYSDFYDENRIDEQSLEQQAVQSVTNNGPNTSEVDALKAELEALRAEAEQKKDLMTLDEFLAKQKELEDAKEKKRRQKFRIVGSRERVNASALDGGVFVAGNKVYKWGDTKVLDQ